jgi:hypothetical protein
MNDEIGTLKDALALIASAERNDGEAVELLLDSYHGPHNERERGMLVGAMLAHSVAILRAASQAAGVEPARILGAVALSLADA